MADVALGGLMLTTGIVWRGSFWWGGILGLALGLGSFHLLVAQASRVGMTGGLAAGLTILFSSLKLMGIFLAVLGLHALQLVDLVHVLIGLLLSQVGIAIGIMFAMSGVGTKPVIRSAKTSRVPETPGVSAMPGEALVSDASGVPGAISVNPASGGSHASS